MKGMDESNHEEILSKKHFVKAADGSWTKKKPPTAIQAATEIFGEAYVKEFTAGVQTVPAPGASPFRPEMLDVNIVGTSSPKRAKASSTDEQKLNKTEKSYLAYLRGREDIAHIGIQNITLKLAHDCRLTPDFNYQRKGRTVFVDVKGFQREDALIKMKVAARQFPWADFEIVFKEKDGWKVRAVQP